MFGLFPYCIVLIFLVGVAVGVWLYRALKKTKRLQEERDSLLRQSARLLEEIDRLEKELDKYEFTEIKIALTLPEKRIILDALESPQYKARVQEPRTKSYIRIIYNTLRKKIKESIKQ